MKIIFSIIISFVSASFLYGQDKFKNPKENFEELVNSLLEHYIDKDLTKEHIYELASAGLLEKLNKEHDWNELLPPTKLKHLNDSLNDNIVGIGVMIEFDKEAGNAVVQSTLAGSSAYSAGLVKGDRILRVNGESFHDKDIKEMVVKIQGKAGTKVKLDILRNNEIKNIEFERRKLNISNVSTLERDNTIIIVIKQFNEGTVKSLENIFSNIKSKKYANIIFDLRNCSGGLLDSTIESLDLIVPKGVAIGQLVNRDGEVKKYISKESGIGNQYKIMVLINDKTSSGGELFAASLRSVLKAKLIGMPTFGKWNAQKIDKLKNGFGYKFTVLKFQDPEGKSYENGGLQPDIFVSYDSEMVANHHADNDLNKQIKVDIQLITAINLLN